MRMKGLTMSERIPAPAAGYASQGTREKDEKALRNCAESIAKDENTHGAPKHNAKRRSVSGQLWEEQPKAFEQALPAQVSLKQPQAHKATTRRANSETSIPLRSV